MLLLGGTSHSTDVSDQSGDPSKVTILIILVEMLNVTLGGYIANYEK